MRRDHDVEDALRPAALIAAGAPSRTPSSLLTTEPVRIGPRRIPLTLTSRAAAVSAIVAGARAGTMGAVHLVNAWTIVCAHDDPNVADALERADLRLTDGMPLVWFGRRLARGPVDRLYGPDLLLDVADAGRDVGLRHLLLGGAPGVAQALADTLRRRYPGVDIAAAHAPSVAPRPDAHASLGALIADSGAHIVWLGLGTPKQDLWAAALTAGPTPRATVVGVGAAFDFLTGAKPQAPRAVQRLGLEWAFRLACEPRRLARRYLIGIPRFLALLARTPHGGPR